jgi:hypothetical protein
MRMPFGKFRGWPLDQVPDGYLLWVLDNCKNASPTLQEAIRMRLGANPRRGSAPALLNWEQVLTVWYRRLCLDFHPDRGGSTVAMQVINVAYTRLRQLLERARQES